MMKFFEWWSMAPPKNKPLDFCGDQDHDPRLQNFKRIFDEFFSALFNFRPSVSIAIFTDSVE